MKQRAHFKHKEKLLRVGGQKANPNRNERNKWGTWSEKGLTDLRRCSFSMLKAFARSRCAGLTLLLREVTAPALNKGKPQEQNPHGWNQHASKRTSHNIFIHWSYLPIWQWNIHNIAGMYTFVRGTFFRTRPRKRSRQRRRELQGSKRRGWGDGDWLLIIINFITLHCTFFPAKKWEVMEKKKKTQQPKNP